MVPHIARVWVNRVRLPNIRGYQSGTVRGLLDRKLSEELVLQSSDESIRTKTKQKRQKERNNNTKRACHKKIEEQRRELDGESLV